MQALFDDILTAQKGLARELPAFVIEDLPTLDTLPAEVYRDSPAKAAMLLMGSCMSTFAFCFEAAQHHGGVLMELHTGRGVGHER